MQGPADRSAAVCITLSILNCVIELRSSVYSGEPLRPRPLDVRVSVTLQNAPTPMGPDIQREVAGYLAMARRTILTTAEADQRNIRSAGLRTPAGPRSRTWVKIIVVLITRKRLPAHAGPHRTAGSHGLETGGVVQVRE